LQNETDILTTDTKARLIRELVEAGFRRIEVTSFVSPKWIPQLADADELVDLLPEHEGVRYAGLVPNIPGWDRFCSSGRLHDIALFISVSETHNQKNVNKPVATHFERLRQVIERSAEAGVPSRVYVSTAFGCPYEGAVAQDAVVDLAVKLHEAGADEIAIGDTIGVGTPAQARAMFEAVAEEIPIGHLAAHFHDTYGQALANLFAVLERGIAVIDASVAGLGGCPYADGATGNVASEDVLYMLNGLGIVSGIDLEAVAQAGCFIAGHLGRPPTSKVNRAMTPPSP